MLIRHRILVSLCLGVGLLASAAGAGTDPTVVELPATDHPEIPPGLKVTCLLGPDSLRPSSTCPVIRWGSITYWVFSHDDNRVAMTIVAYDAAGNAVRQWYKPGARYVWRISRESRERVFKIWGQGNQAIEAAWGDLEVQGPQATTVFVVRHAEKEESGSDPPLTPMGERRAQALANMLRSSAVTAVYSTSWTRTRETVNNTADAHGIGIQFYTEPEEVVGWILDPENSGKTVLVAGHSNTVPQIVVGLGVETPPWVGDQFDNLFVVTVCLGGPAKLARLKYPPFRTVRPLDHIERLEEPPGPR